MGVRGRIYGYAVGIATRYGRRAIDVQAKSRMQACNIAWGEGHTVVDCEYKKHDAR